MDENLERPNYYAIIPANVRYSDVSANAKLLYGEITALCNKTGTCWASNQYFSSLYGVKANAISGWVKQLADAGFITTKINKSAGNKRLIRITDVPITKKEDSYHEKRGVNNNTSNNKHIVELEKNLLVLVNKITGRNFRTLPHGTKKTLDTFSLVEIESALTALVRDPWHTQRIKELSLNYLLRATTIDRFVSQKVDADAEPYGYRNGEKIWTKDEDGNSYFGGVKMTAQNQDQLIAESEAQRNGTQ